MEHIQNVTSSPSISSENHLISFEASLAILILTFSSLLFGLIPYFLFRRSHRHQNHLQHGSQLNSPWYKITLSTLSSFTGGILLSTTMLHILPEVREKSQLISEDSSWLFYHEYPSGEMLMLYGFCLIYLLEELAHFLIHKKHNHNHFNQYQGDLNLKQECVENHQGKMAHHTFIPFKEDDHHGECHSGLIFTKGDDVVEGSVPSEGSDEHFRSDGVKKGSLGTLRALISLAALSFHAIMEGIAVGVQDSSDLWFAFGAVASHKFIISFCLGMELVKSHATFRTLISSIIIFSVVSPTGILIGSSLSSNESLEHSPALVIIEGLACGTLLYVVFFEILTSNHNHDEEEDQSGKHTHKGLGLFQFFGTFSGIILAGFLIINTGHSHHSEDHLHDHDHHYHD